MKHSCKICGGATSTRYTIKDITYYYCPGCDFLQNYYWEDHPNPDSELSAINQETRKLRWPAGESEHMRNKGWEMLELMYWPLAWLSRIIHTLLKHLPGYKLLTQWWIKRKTSKILDFGCGYGITVFELRTKDNINIIGLDPYSPTESPHIERRQLTETHIPDNTFNGIFTIETTEHLPNVLEVFRQLHRILKPGGVLLVQTRRLEDPDYIDQQAAWFYLREPKTHISIYSEKAMREIARRTEFSKVQFRGAKFARFIK